MDNSMAISGVSDRWRKGYFSEYALNSAMYLPACLINHTGGRSTSSPRAALKRIGSSLLPSFAEVSSLKTARRPLSPFPPLLLILFFVPLRRDEESNRVWVVPTKIDDDDALCEMNIFVLVLVYKYSHGRETKVVVHALLIKGVSVLYLHSPLKRVRRRMKFFCVDILTPLPALGVEFDVVRGKGPVVEPVRSMEEVKKLKTLDDPDSSLPFIRPILSTLRKEIEGQSTMLGFIGAPWTLAAYAIEGKSDRHLVVTKQMMTKNPEILHAFLAHLAEALGVYVCHQIDCGAQVVQLFDSWAHHLSPQQFAEFSHPYNERVMEIVRAKYPDTPLIFHANGGHGKLHEIKRSTADVIGLDWETDMAEARSIMPDRILQGNMDPMYLFASEERIRKEVANNVRDAGNSKHILNVGHGVVQGTPEGNVGAFCDAARASVYADMKAPAR
jgi:uroporphyrinogen decarboxylase